MKLNESLDFSVPGWENYSSQLKDLVNKMVKYSAQERYSA